MHLLLHFQQICTPISKSTQNLAHDTIITGWIVVESVLETTKNSGLWGSPKRATKINPAIKWLGRILWLVATYNVSDHQWTSPQLPFTIRMKSEESLAGDRRLKDFTFAPAQKTPHNIHTQHSSTKRRGNLEFFFYKFLLSVVEWDNKLDSRQKSEVWQTPNRKHKASAT